MYVPDKTISESYIKNCKTPVEAAINASLIQQLLEKGDDAISNNFIIFFERCEEEFYHQCPFKLSKIKTVLHSLLDIYLKPHGPYGETCQLVYDMQMCFDRVGMRYSDDELVMHMLDSTSLEIDDHKGYVPKIQKELEAIDMAQKLTKYVGMSAV